ncbi:MAG: putative F420-0 ABC transporter substrate-binding protein [Microbacteriaceae bacterium]
MRRSSRKSSLSRPTILTVLAWSTSVLLLSGCAGAPASSAPSPSTSTSHSGYPIAVDNCGTQITFDAAPKRVVTIKSTSTEMLLALGLGNRIVGSAFSDGPAATAWAKQAKSLKILSDKIPAQEVVLEQRPDLVYAGWESNFSADGAGTRSTLHSLGVNSYVSPAACQEAAYKPAKLQFSNVFAEITEIGRIFNVPQAAATLIASQKRQLATVTPVEHKPSALWWSSASSTPYVGAGIGAPQMIMDAVGLTNIAANVKDTWSPLSWEAIIAANPSVIVLVDASWSTAQKKIGLLESNPATAGLYAVQHKRYLILPFAESEAGVRNVGAVLDLAGQLAALEKNP